MSMSKVVFFFQFILIPICAKRHETRKSRLFTFNTVDDDLRIDLEFSIPFISFPVKRTMDAAFGTTATDLPKININPASLALGGAILLGTTVLIPLIVKGLLFENHQRRYSKILEAAEFDTTDLLDFASKMLLNNHNIRGCALKIACWTGESSSRADIMKMWNHILSNQLLSSMINATTIEDAMLSGKHGRSCATFKPCPLTDQHRHMIIKSIFMLTSNLT